MAKDDLNERSLIGREVLLQTRDRLRETEIQGRLEAVTDTWVTVSFNTRGRRHLTCLPVASVHALDTWEGRESNNESE